VGTNGKWKNLPDHREVVWVDNEKWKMKGEGNGELILNYEF
jgi:hypothetical protein